MDVTLSLPFLQFSSSGGSASFMLFMAFSLTWIIGIFAYAGLTSTLSKIASVLS